MQNITQTLKSLKRPRLLVRTARIALSGFRREAGLKTVFGYDVSANSDDILNALFEREDEINILRKTGDASYNIARHISVLTALMFEANLQLSNNDPVT